MTRNTKKPITDESYDKSGFFDLYTNPPASPVARYPLAPRVLNDDPVTRGPVDFWIIRNRHLTADVRVAFDSDASATNGHVVHAGEDFDAPCRASGYVSIWSSVGGLHTEIHWFSW